MWNLVDILTTSGGTEESLFVGQTLGESEEVVHAGPVFVLGFGCPFDIFRLFVLFCLSLTSGGSVGFH